MAEDTTVSSVAADLADERLIRTQGLAGYADLVLAPPARR